MKNLLHKSPRSKRSKIVWLVGVWMAIVVNSQPLMSQRLAAGTGAGLFICSDSTVMVWGLEIEVPIAVEGDPGRMIAVSGGGLHLLTLRADSTVWAGGVNEDGQLGLSDTLTRTTLVQVPGLSDIVAISAGGLYSLALRSDSTVWAWGDNFDGQLGLNDTIDRWVPQQVMGLTGIVKIAAGGFFSLALQDNGQVWAWGSNEDGQIGDGNAAPKRTIPVLLTGVDSIVEISAGGFHSLALQSNGQAWAWGQNEDGQLGLGDTLDRSIPVPMTNGNGVRALSGGAFHTLALRNNGSVWVVGDNAYGQLGLGDTLDKTVLTPLGGNWMATSVVAGGGHSLAISPDGSIWAWGANNIGQLGNGTLTNQWTPTPVLGLCPTYFAAPDSTFNSYFQPTTSATNHWIAGELSSSIALPNGRTLFIFGKSHLDNIDPNNTIPCGQEIANCLIVQDNVVLGDLTTYLDTTPGNASRAYFQPDSSGSSHFLPNHGYVENADTVTIFLSEYADDSTFLWNYAARVGLVTMTVLDITKCIPGNDKIDFGKAVIVDSSAGQLYLYGSKKDSTGRYPYLVRRDLANDSATWYYATPLGWSPTLADAGPVSAHEVSENFSVTALQGQYYLITHNIRPDTVKCSLQRHVLAYRSNLLKGPFEAVAILATTPDSVAHLPIFGFGAYTHASLGHCDSLLLSYNVSDLYMLPDSNGCPSQCATGSSLDADTWRPKFIRVPYSLLDTTLSTTLTASCISTHVGTTWTFTNTSALADSYLWDFGDNHQSTSVNPTHTYGSPGIYTVTLTAFGCGTSVTSAFVAPSDPSELFSTLLIYPHPSNGQFHIHATDLDKGPVTIEVHTLLGQTILRETHQPIGGILHTTLDLKVRSGIYLLRFTNNNNTIVRKLVIE